MFSFLLLFVAVVLHCDVIAVHYTIIVLRFCILILYKCIGKDYIFPVWFCTLFHFFLGTIIDGYCFSCFFCLILPSECTFIHTPPCPAETNFCVPKHQCIRPHLDVSIAAHVYFLFGKITVFAGFYCWFRPSLYAHSHPACPTAPHFLVLPHQCTYTNPSTSIPGHPWPSLSFHSSPSQCHSTSSNCGDHSIWHLFNTYIFAHVYTSAPYFCVPTISTHPYASISIRFWSWLTFIDTHHSIE